MATTPCSAQAKPQYRRPSQLTLVWRYLRRNKSLAIGLIIILGLTLFTVIGLLTINPKHAYPLSVAGKQPPSLKYPFGTDFFGRDLLAAMVVGMWQTALIGILAGGIGTVIGVVLGFISAYFGGLARCRHQGHLPDPDAHPGLPDSGRHRRLARQARRHHLHHGAGGGAAGLDGADAGDPLAGADDERAPVRLGRQAVGRGRPGHHLSARSCPTCCPSSPPPFVGQVFAAVFASFYLAVLGLGPLREPLMGNIIWAAQSQSAFFNGWWWWPLEPAAGHGADPGLAGPDQHGPGRAGQPAHPPVRVEARMTSQTRVNWAVTEAPPKGDKNPVLQVVDLQVSYYTDAGRATALDGVNLSLAAGEKLGLVGESGSGKSTMALAMMRMIKPPGRIEGGQVIVDGIDLMTLNDQEMLQARLSKIAYIPQGAMNSLNPVMRIGAQMVDAIQAHDPRAPPQRDAGTLDDRADLGGPEAGRLPRCSRTS